jgi:hypothetical protein
MKLKVAVDKKNEVQDENQRLEELDDRIADTKVSATCQSSFMCDQCEVQKRMMIKYSCLICKIIERTSIEVVTKK